MILTSEHQMIRDAMRSFAQERLAPHSAAWDRDKTFPAAALKELGALGAMGMTLPEAYGGAGMDTMSLVLTLEEIAVADGATSTIVSVQNSLACGRSSAGWCRWPKAMHWAAFASPNRRPARTPPPC
jgi:butyryl-CoA dehydrogenase